MFQWPDGRSIAVAPIVPWERWPDDLGTAASHQRQSQSPNPPEAQYEWNMWVLYDHDYAEMEGVERLLELFDRHQVKVTFVINGLRLVESPDLAREVARRGHETASENFVHVYPPMYTADQERQSLVDTIAAFDQVLGTRPIGYVSPGHRPTPNTLPILFDLGYEWHADFQNSDSPFLIDGPGGKVMVGTPYSYLTDYQTYLQVGRTPRMWLEMMRDELAGLRREGQAAKPRMMGLAMHPFLCHPFRTAVIDEFLGEVLSYPDVWVATRRDIAAWVREHPNGLRRVTMEDVLARFPAPSR